MRDFDIKNSDKTEFEVNFDSMAPSKYSKAPVFELT